LIVLNHVRIEGELDWDKLNHVPILMTNHCEYDEFFEKSLEQYSELTPIEDTKAFNYFMGAL